MTALVMAAVIAGLGVVPAHEWWTERRRARAADARGLEAWHAGLNATPAPVSSRRRPEVAVWGCGW